jgi:hypothetical protein
MKHLLGLTIVLSGIFLVPFLTSTTNAQIAEDIIGKNLFLETDTPYPKPNTHVEVKLNDYTYGRTVTSIKWYVNGSEMKEVANQRNIILAVGDVGSITNVVAKIISNDSFEDSTSIILQPFYLDIIVEPETRTPSFYKGRGLPSVGAKISTTAILGGISESAENFNYTWELNNKPIEGGGMRGKNKISFTAPQGKEFILSVSVKSLSGNTIAQRSIVIQSFEPSVLFYETSTLLGIKPTALKEAILSGDTITLKAEPYNLDLYTYNNPEHLAWEIDFSPTQNISSNPYEITFARNPGVFKSSVISFEVRSLSNLLQGGSADLNVKF